MDKKLEFKGWYNEYCKLKKFQKDIENTVRIVKLSVDLEKGNVNPNN